MQDFMITLLICSVTMSALALFYMAVTPLLAKRYSVTGRYYTWLVIVIGLIIPFRPQFSNAIVRVDMPGYTAAPVIQTGNGTPVTVPVQNTQPSVLTDISWLQIAAVVWLVGMILFLVYHMIKHYRFLKLAARWSKKITDEQTLTLVQELKTQMRLTKNIGLRFCDSIGSPMMIGFANPRILLPKADFAKDELCFILKHELVHCKRKDLWYKCLLLIATAIHWFNPVVYLIAKAIDIQCELSCDREVVHSADADTRLYYSETIIGVVRRQSKRKTALSTNFYGGKKGMKKRIFSIMDMNKKKAGLSILCGALILTLGTGTVFAANVNTQDAPKIVKENIDITPRISVSFLPNPDTYAPYAAFGLTISADGTKLLYKGQPVRLFVDEKSDAEAFYLDGAGDLNLSAVRNAAGDITGIERMSAQKAQEYYEEFFAEELDHGFSNKAYQESLQDLAKDVAKEGIQEGNNKYEKYQPFGVTYSATDEILYFNGQRVKFFIDQYASGGAGALWADNAGTVNVAAVRDASGQVTGVESISDEKALEYQSAANEYARIDEKELEKKLTAKLEKLYAKN